MLNQNYYFASTGFLFLDLIKNFFLFNRILKYISKKRKNEENFSVAMSTYDRKSLLDNRYQLLATSSIYTYEDENLTSYADFLK